MNAKILLITLGVVLLMSQLLFCNKDAEVEDSDLYHLETLYRGCNGQTDPLAGLQKSSADPDTVFYTISDDTLSITIGHNYICCAPFVVISEQEGTNLTLTLRDTCSAPYDSCYCYCYCYYEFQVDYLNYHGEELQLSVYIHDPTQTGDSLIHELVIDGLGK